MRWFLPSAVFCAALFACASDPPTAAPPDSGTDTQPVIDHDASQDGEVTEVPARQPEVSSDATTTSIEQWEEGDDTHWYTPIWPFPWPWHHGGPGKKPYRKQCTPELGEEACLQCCDYNFDHVDGWDCRKLKKYPGRARECWERAAETLGRCQRFDCNRMGIPPILTVSP